MLNTMGCYCRVYLLYDHGKIGDSFLTFLIGLTAAACKVLDSVKLTVGELYATDEVSVFCRASNGDPSFLLKLGVTSAVLASLGIECQHPGFVQISIESWCVDYAAIRDLRLWNRVSLLPVSRDFLYVVFSCQSSAR